MNSLANKMNVMNLLGKGLSVNTLLERADITMGELCELADQYPDLHSELKRWYKRYDFGLLKEGKDFVKKETTITEPIILETKEEKPKTVRKPRKKVEAK
jgi:hypothetical protein